MIESFREHINENLPFLNKSKLLVAISGGIDSVVLTYLCYELKLDFALAHCNFNLRGDESDADENFVVELADKLGVEVFIQHFDTHTYGKAHKLSIQMAARELRYNWFTELARQLHFDYILTAHHADDNLETFLINFTRGTGLEGLTGIPEVNGVFVRPLLSFSSQMIENYSKVNTIKWREDSSNQSVKYLRNKLRHKIIPVLREINPSLLQSFQVTLNNLKETSVLVNNHMQMFLNDAITQKADGVIKYKISEFKKLKHPKPYLYESFKNFGFTEWNDVVNLLDAQPGKQVFSNTHRLIKDRDYLLLAKNIAKKSIETINVSKDNNEVQTPIGVMTFNKTETILHTSLNTIFVDASRLHYPLTLRKKKEGDYFYPLGMKGKKKLSKYFKDEKFSLLEKENTWLLCSGNIIVWVVGKRADNRFKVTENTENILKIELKK